MGGAAVAGDAPLYIHSSASSLRSDRVFPVVTAILQLLDLGLGTVLNRQFAQYSTQSARRKKCTISAYSRDHLLAHRHRNRGDHGRSGTGIAGLWLKPQQLSGSKPLRKPLR